MVVPKHSAAALNALASVLKIASFPATAFVPPEKLSMPNGWFKPTDRVPVTGIYTAKHDQHRKEHEVFAKEGETFPNCRRCGERVSFALTQAPSGTDDPGFGTARKSKAKRSRRKSPGK